MGTHSNCLDNFIKTYVVGTHLNCLNLSKDAKFIYADNRLQSGPSCSKLTTSFVNNSLKFTLRDNANILKFFAEKNVSSFCTHMFSAKNIRILYIESIKTINEMTLNELVKLTVL